VTAQQMPGDMAISSHSLFCAVAAQSAAEGLPFTVAEVDCDESKTICERYGATSYPTVTYIEGGKTWKYVRDRDDVSQMKKFPKDCQTDAPSEIIEPVSMVQGYVTLLDFWVSSIVIHLSGDAKAIWDQDRDLAYMLIAGGFFVGLILAFFYSMCCKSTSKKTKKTSKAKKNK